MRNARFMVVAASAFVIQLVACGGGGSDGGGSTLGGNSSGGGGSSGSHPDAGTSGSSGNSSGGTSSGSPADAGGVDPNSKCAPLIGKWHATIDPGAVATGTDTTLTGPVPISGVLDFTLTHDDADLPDIVDFNGTATITAEGQTLTETIAPASSPSGDTKDTQCDGGLHLKGLVNVQAVGNLIFVIDGTLDTTSSPTSGVGTFTWKTADDDGGGLTATGGLHLVKQ
jgi:hypothetical protein